MTTAQGACRLYLVLLRSSRRRMTVDAGRARIEQQVSESGQSETTEGPGSRQPLRIRWKSVSQPSSATTDPFQQSRYSESSPSLLAIATSTSGQLTQRILCDFLQDSFCLCLLVSFFRLLISSETKPDRTTTTTKDSQPRQTSKGSHKASCEPLASRSFWDLTDNGSSLSIRSMTTMASTIAVHQRAEDFGLDAVVQHNAAVTSTEQFPAYVEDAKGLGIYQDAYAQYQDDGSYLNNPPTPRSNTSDGMRTRSGRSTRQTDSPYSSRVSKSPAPRSKKDRKSKANKSNVPKIDQPLSVLTKDSEVPLKDMDAWVNRSAEVRRQEVEKRNGYVTRPMNSFMLYRSAFAERTKHWCLQNNHQVVSSVAGESWPLEPQEVRDQYNDWAKLERANHAAAHPEYKFSPSKSANKRRKGEFSDEEDEISLDGDPDGDYRGPHGRSVRQRRGPLQDSVPLNNTYGFDSHPYFGQQATGFEQSQYQYANPGRPLPSNIAYDHNGMPYNPQTGTYIQQQTYQHPQYPYVQDVRGVRIPTPNNLNGAQQQHSVGGYGLPGRQQQQMNADELFNSSRTGTPMQQYNQYGQPVYPRYTTTHHHQQQQQTQFQPDLHQTSPYEHPAPPPPVSQAYAEHQAYLQAASQPQTAIDPTLEAELGMAAGAGESHFDSAIGDLTAGDLEGLEYYQEPAAQDASSIDPAWHAVEDLK
ncbi:HMG (high mobility group) box [Teratosphaeria destructans]|uniref:HMG (High mobility group) box n=1 Tax=Teratosphaeria destructans TaxID=418781 RepID=A0A9W7SZG3_9PEZI|nr:HMG (high mobility group) box [Teratosphaeria destructans]